MESKKYVKMPYFVKQQIIKTAKQHARAHLFDDMLIKYFKDNDIYDEIKNDYIQFIVNDNCPEIFIEKFTQKYE